MRIPGTSCVLRFTKQFLPGRQLDVVMAGLCRELGNQSRNPFVQNPALDWYDPIKPCLYMSVAVFGSVRYSGQEGAERWSQDLWCGSENRILPEAFEIFLIY